MLVIVVLTATDKMNTLLYMTGLRKKVPANMGGYGEHFDPESRIDDDNQLIDDIEDDRW